MRFDWDDSKSERRKLDRGLSFDEAATVFSGPYVLVPKSDDPEQFAAIGFAQNRLITLIHEYREDEEGKIHLASNLLEGHQTGGKIL